MYTQLGVLTKGTVVEVNVSELGMVTTGGKVVFGKYAQITNNPENDGCVNAVLREFPSSPSCTFLTSTGLQSYRVTYCVTTYSSIWNGHTFPIHGDHQMYPRDLCSKCNVVRECFAKTNHQL